MLKTCVIIGNGGTLAGWPRLGAIPGVIQVATNNTWSWCDPNIIITTRAEARQHIPDSVYSRIHRMDSEWTTSGAAAMAWAAREDFDRIIALAFDTSLNANTASRCVDHYGGRRTTLWAQEMREVMLFYPRLLTRVNTAVTRKELAEIETVLGVTRTLLPQQ